MSGLVSGGRVPGDCENDLGFLILVGPAVTGLPRLGREVSGIMKAGSNSVDADAQELIASVR